MATNTTAGSFQSRPRAYPSSDDRHAASSPVAVAPSFNPALGLIHLLTEDGCRSALAGEPFNPALGLIHLLTPGSWMMCGGGFICFQSRPRAYPSSDGHLTGCAMRISEPFNPALGLIHLLTQDYYSTPMSSTWPFNPALGLIHLLTGEIENGINGVGRFQSRPRAYPSSDHLSLRSKD